MLLYVNLNKEYPDQHFFANQDGDLVEDRPSRGRDVSVRRVFSLASPTPIHKQLSHPLLTTGSDSGHNALIERAAVKLSFPKISKIRTKLT